MTKILEVKDLRTSFFTHVGEVKSVRGISFSVDVGEAIGIVGESGSGKSVTMMSAMQILQDTGKIVGGQVIFEGRDLVSLSEKEMEKIRGNEMSMIFQDPMTALNPLFTVGNQLREGLMKHKKLSKNDANEEAVKMLELVGIPSPRARLKQYPHEFSGGMRQRVMIAMALTTSPKLLIADEPTTALDVTIQAQILELIKDIKDKLNTSVILITHDLGVVADVCSKIVVMYGGTIVEKGSTRDIFYNAKHPYTWGLLNSIPNPNREGKEKLVPIEGTPPDLLNPPVGCPFAARCNYAMEVCLTAVPPMYKVGESGKHSAACYLCDEKAPVVESPLEARYKKGIGKKFESQVNKEEQIEDENKGGE